MPGRHTEYDSKYLAREARGMVKEHPGFLKYRGFIVRVTAAGDGHDIVMLVAQGETSDHKAVDIQGRL